MVPSQPLVAIPLAVLLFFFTLPRLRKIAISERDPSLERVMRKGLVLHLIAAPVQIWVVDHYYHGITDYNRYVNQGVELAHRFDSFNFSLSGTHISFLGEGAVSVAAGVVFGIVGIDKLAGFFVFSWLAFLGSVCFYRAFTTTFPEAPTKRYARLIFFFPSILFWTSGISKETVMYVALGIAAYGAARILAQRRGGAVMLAAGTGLGVYIRPQELLLFLCVVAFVTLFRRRSRKPLGAVRRVLVMGVQILLILGALALTNQLAKHGSAVYNLNQVAKNNAGQASSVAYSSNPLKYYHDLYVMLLDPLPFNAHSGGQRVAAIENSFLIVTFFLSLGRLKLLPRVSFLRPYVMLCFVYSAVFCYAFAALGNLGLIDRERVLMVPFILVMFAIPISKKDDPPEFDWELNHGARKRRVQQRLGAARSYQAIPRWVTGSERPG